MASGPRGLTRRWIEPAPCANGVPLVERLLAARGLRDAEQLRQFCDPKLTDLHDPSLLHDCDLAAIRLVEAVKAGRVIAIYGDYDVDGICATAILYHVVRAACPGADIRTYVPHRLDEGYGLNSDALRQLARQGAHLVVSVDCGITAVEPAKAAREAGLELIITDHHALPSGGPSAECRVPSDQSPPHPLPPAVAIVHPQLPGSNGPYPFTDLSGAGVAFKLAWRFASVWCGSQRVSEHLQKTLMDTLPLAALGTIADVVPLTGENRVIARYGLRLIRQSPLVGLRALLEESGLVGEHVDSEHVGFALGPRLNACGRMGHAAEAVHLFTSATESEAREIAARLSRANQERQLTERRMAEEAIRKAEDAGMTGPDRRIIVLADKSWHAGVVGIVCSRLVDRFCRPTILLHDQGETCKGSARSIDGYPMHEALSAAASLLLTHGGHDMAAGLSLRTDDLPAFIAAISEHAGANIGEDQLIPSASIDCEAALAELDIPTVQRLEALSPFGRGNPQPRLRLRGLTLAETPKQMGAQGKHLSLNLRCDANGQRRWIRGVWWSKGSLACDLAAGMPLDAIIQPKINRWNGRVNVEAQIVDVRIAER